MRLTTKGHYAVRVLIDLASHNDGVVRLQEIATRQSISLHYLEQLFRKLRVGRLVSSCRGPGGGYHLSRPASKISVRDILECVGENINPARDILGVPSSDFEPTHIYDPSLGFEVKAFVDTPELHKTRSYFDGLGKMMGDYLSNTTLADLKNREVA